MAQFSSNTDLFRYLETLANTLETLGAPDLAANVQCAADQSAGLSTEFLGESLIALDKVLPRAQGILSETQCEDLRHAIVQIHRALKR